MKFEYREGKAYEVLKEIKKAIEGSYWENKVFLVGGAVRDHLLNKEIKDIDLCVNVADGGISFSKWICEEFDCYKPTTNPCTFPAYGTAKFNLRSLHELADMDIECVQTRKEQYRGDSRKPETVFGTIQEDAKRRDLTINALYVNISNDEIIDPCGMGLDDIMNGIIRTPSDPNVVFKDDPLRMLRVVRFATKLGWGIDKDTWIGIVSNTHRIDIISQERITDELTKILVCDTPSIGIKRLDNCGLLVKVLPEIHRLKGVTQGVEHVGDVFAHTMLVLDKVKPYPNHRWAALFHDVAKPYTKTLKNGKIHFYNHETMGHTITDATLRRMKFSVEDVKQISSAVKQHMRFKSSKNTCPSNKALRKFMSENELKDLAIVLDVIDADNKSHSSFYCMEKQVTLIIDKLNEMYVKNKEPECKPPLTGKDIMEHFSLKPGPKIGELLDVVKELCLDDPYVTKEKCLEHLELYV